MERKTGTCKTCCPNGGAVFHAKCDENGNKVWECCNCWSRTSRRVNKRRDENSPLTLSQIAAITRIQMYKVTDKVEIKRLSVCNLGYLVSVVVETGMKGDEGTMAAVLCRDRGHFFVRPGGAIEAVEVDKGIKTKAAKYPLIYGWRH